MTQTICTTSQDKERLFTWLQESAQNTRLRDQPSIRAFEEALGQADTIADLRETPGDLITMRSSVQLRNLNTGKTFTCTLVYPTESDPYQHQISVLAPLGRAMLGRRVGDILEARLPVGPTTFRVEAIDYQPEAAGDYHR